ncbi:MAG: sulfotransferase domain-containing protein [Flavobacteriales bacterium]|nr:sulfotransferase domain-containing protein [Flavobacteriales bacterium]
MNSPNFMCIGAAKSGTTTLYEILKQHPEIGVSSFKEPHFFDNNDNWSKGVEWYEKTYFSDFKEKRLIGDFTASYLSINICPKRIKEIYGEKMKFIVLLRNPIDRAYSQFLHSKRDEYEDLVFLEALAEEKKRLKKFEENNDMVSYSRFGYINHGMYAKHFKEYFNYFDREQFCVILFSDFINNRKDKVKEIIEFLNLDVNIKLNINIASNQASKARSKKLKKFLKKETFVKKLAKFFLPSFAIRQKIRNLIHASNNKVAAKKPLNKNQRKECYNNYFMDDIVELENTLGINLKTWKEC